MLTGVTERPGLGLVHAGNSPGRSRVCQEGQFVTAKRKWQPPASECCDPVIDFFERAYASRGYSWV
jgi:hypothetical protein